MSQSSRMVCDGVFETMKDCRRTLGSPKPLLDLLDVW
jgi:hypothetical protein